MRHEINLEAICPMCGNRDLIAFYPNMSFKNDLMCIVCTDNDSVSAYFYELTGRIVQVVESDPSDKIEYIPTNYDFMKSCCMFDDCEKVEEVEYVIKHGFSYAEIANLCDYIARFIQPRMSAFRKMFARRFHGKAYYKAIRMMDISFRLFNTRQVGLDSCEFGKTYTAIARKGLIEFGKRFGALWD